MEAVLTFAVLTFFRVAVPIGLLLVLGELIQRRSRAHKPR
jgi:hypothetical protein